MRCFALVKYRERNKMWAQIGEKILDVLLGIISGIFSGIMVSYIFLIDSEYKQQIDHAEELFKPIYCLIVIGDAYDLYKEAKEKRNPGIDNLGNPAEVRMLDSMNKCWDQITTFFEDYKPWRYKYELGDILNEINEFISDGKYWNRTTHEDYAEIRTKFKKYIREFEACQRDYKKEIAKRIWFNKLIFVMVVTVLVMVLALVIIA